jgi:hypothetical protein
MSPKVAWWGILAVAFLMVLAGFVVMFERGEEGPAPAQKITGVLPLAPPEVKVESSQFENTSSQIDARKDAFRNAAVHDVPVAPALRLRADPTTPKSLHRVSRSGSAGPMVGMLVVTARFQGRNVPGHLLIDGAYKGATPYSGPLPSGSHLFRIDYAGAPVNEFMTDVQGGRSTQLDVELRGAEEARRGERNPKRLRAE